LLGIIAVLLVLVEYTVEGMRDIRLVGDLRSERCSPRGKLEDPKLKRTLLLLLQTATYTSFDREGEQRAPRFWSMKHWKVNKRASNQLEVLPN
jgi:hypothetical protein